MSISDSQRGALPFASWIATVPHGLPLDLYTPSVCPSRDYLAFVGRICPEKRPDRAIDIARPTGMRLKIAAKVDPADRSWFQEVIEPELDDPLIDFHGEIDDAGKGELLGNALATLFPIDWPEPFGLVMIESMACGTPVIAWNCGSVPGVLEHGVTGFIVESMKDAVHAVSLAGTLDPDRIRETFESRFSATAMARRYLEIYESLLEKERRAMLRLEAG